MFRVSAGIRITGTYYGIKKLQGKGKDHSLDTAGRKVAGRKLKEWINGLDKLDVEAQKTTLETLLDRLQKIVVPTGETGCYGVRSPFRPG